MDLLGDDITSLSNSTKNLMPVMSCKPPSLSGTPRPSRPPSPKQFRNEESSSGSYVTAVDYGAKPVSNQKHSCRFARSQMEHVELPNLMEPLCKESKGKLEAVDGNEVVHKTPDVSSQKQVLELELKPSRKQLVSDSPNCNLNGFQDTEAILSGLCEGGGNEKLNSKLPALSATASCSSPQHSLYSATLYAEAKQSFTNTEASECSSSVEKLCEGNAEVSNSCDILESRKTSAYGGSTGSDISDDSSSSSLSSAMYRPHKANDTRWEAVKAIRARDGALGLKHFRLLRRLGCGDIGSVYLSELTGTRSYFAMKIMDKAALAGRKKLLRAQTEREILQSLDHPFLPTLYTHFETEKFSCLVMEFCPGGDLHALRQRRPGKFFPEHAARFYVAEVLLALEYLHMLGIIYRDLKPENVLVREDGHIMLSDFDLSLKCAVCPTLVKSSNTSSDSKTSGYCVLPACIEPSCVIQPACIQPTCFSPRFLSGNSKKERKNRAKSEAYHQMNPLPELIAEPTSARSMSFVGTHEYLAPEIIKGEGHGSAVDWWTFGIFLYELLFGRTPFKGAGNRATLFNVVGQPLKFPDSPTVSFAARDLIRGLLVKEPQHRLAYRRGATEVKQHAFFQSVNWALIRCASPPEVPKPVVMIGNPTSNAAPKALSTENAPGLDVKSSDNYLEIDFF